MSSKAPHHFVKALPSRNHRLAQAQAALVADAVVTQVDHLQ